MLQHVLPRPKPPQSFGGEGEDIRIPPSQARKIPQAPEPTVPVHPNKAGFALSVALQRQPTDHLHSSLAVAFWSIWDLRGPFTSSTWTATGNLKYTNLYVPSDPLHLAFSVCSNSVQGRAGSLRNLRTAVATSSPYKRHIVARLNTGICSTRPVAVASRSQTPSAFFT